MSNKPFFVSAPGKVIIFGEHSAVYGKAAIAAALSLRAYLLVSPNQDPNIITLDFPDINLSHSWNRNDIPWEELKDLIEIKDGKPTITNELVPEIVDKLDSCLRDIDIRMHHITCYCFLYLYVHLCDKDVPGQHFCVRSTLPIGAGLGSSAAVSVCLSSALSSLGGRISQARFGEHEKVTDQNTEDADFINNWSLMGEKCFHGNPSGIDNAVATHGGAVMFQRKLTPAQPSVRTTMRNFPSLKLILTNTKIPRSTAALVANVARINNEFPKISNSILDAMGHLSLDAYQIMMRPYFGDQERNELLELININHGLLSALGVSHPTLEKIKFISDIKDIGATKLTGAGGGGCAITLVKSDVEEELIQEVISEFRKEGFETFETALGGKGVGALLFDNVSDENKKFFSPELFNSLKDRDEIEKYLGVPNIDGWKFW